MGFGGGGFGGFRDLEANVGWAGDGEDYGERHTEQNGTDEREWGGRDQHGMVLERERDRQ